MASRHSAFYSPLLCAVKFLRDQGRDVPYSVLQPGQRSHSLIAERAVDIMQSAVSSNWSARAEGVRELPVHFAQINRRDGFFLTAPAPDPAFDWRKLEGATILADHGAQPLAMLKYALAYNRVNSARLVRSGPADYGHYQLPAPGDEIVASVGAAMPPVAFSSLCCARAYQDAEDYGTFLDAFTRGARDEVQAGELGVALSVITNELRSTTRLNASAVRRVAGRNCLEIGGVWIDEQYDPKMPEVTVKAQSDAYFRILERHAEVKPVFQLGNYLVWVTPSGTALIVDSAHGKEKLSDAEIDKLFESGRKSSPDNGSGKPRR